MGEGGHLCLPNHYRDQHRGSDPRAYWTDLAHFAARRGRLPVDRRVLVTDSLASAVSEQILRLSRLCWRPRMSNPFRYFNSSPEVMRLVMMYVRYPLSLRKVEDLLGRARDRHQPRDRPVLVEPVCPDVRRRDP